MSVDVSGDVVATITGDGKGGAHPDRPMTRGRGGRRPPRRHGEAGRLPVVDGAVVLEDDFLGVHEYVLSPG